MDTENAPNNSKDQEDTEDKDLPIDESTAETLPDGNEDKESAFSQKVTETYADNEALKEKYIREGAWIHTR